MNRVIKQCAIDCGVASSHALNDPEGYDGYITYDKLTKFVEQCKMYYMNRAVNECVDICNKLNETQGSAQGCADAIKQHFGVD